MVLPLPLRQQNRYRPSNAQFVDLWQVSTPLQFCQASLSTNMLHLATTHAEITLCSRFAIHHIVGLPQQAGGCNPRAVACLPACKLDLMKIPRDRLITLYAPK
ncbi:hypothetical protein D3C78_470400 [compost metagenome]